MTATAVPAEKQASLWEDFIDVLTAPARVFERRRNAGYGMPLLVVAVLFTVVIGASFPLWRPMLERQQTQQVEQMRQRGMTDEQIQGAQAMGAKILPIVSIAGPAIFIPIVAFLVGAVLLGVAKVLDAQLTYRGAMLVTVYSMVPAVLVAIIGAALLAVLDVESMPTMQQMNVGPVLLLGRDASPVLAAALSRIGIGEIWSTIVTGIGVSVLARTTRAKGFTVAIALWLLGTAFTVFMGFRAAAMQG